MLHFSLSMFLLGSLAEAKPKPTAPTNKIAIMLRVIVAHLGLSYINGTINGITQATICMNMIWLRA